MKRNTERLNVLHEYGWSETNQNQFFQFADKIIGDTFKGTFTIKRVKGSWFWYFKFSNNKITPRTKYTFFIGKFGENQFSRNYYLHLISLGFHR